MLGWIKKNPIKIVLLTIFLTVQYLNFTGFCYSEGRYLSKDELLKRGMGKIYEENPDCCSLYNIQDRDFGYFVNNLFGFHHFGLVTVSKRGIREGDDPREAYKRSWAYITSCGVVHEDYSENIREDAL